MLLFFFLFKHLFTMRLCSFVIEVTCLIRRKFGVAKWQITPNLIFFSLSQIKSPLNFLLIKVFDSQATALHCNSNPYSFTLLGYFSGNSASVCEHVNLKNIVTVFVKGCPQQLYHPLPQQPQVMDKVVRSSFNLINVPISRTLFFQVRLSFENVLCLIGMRKMVIWNI